MADWVIDKESRDRAYADISNRPELVKKWPHFEKDVTADPFYHPKPGRITKLKGRASYSWRYSFDALRVVYYPEKKGRTIFPLSAESATGVFYKKRSKK